MTLKVGLIGCGFIDRFHSAAIRAIASRRLLDVEYRMVCDRDIERARSFAEITGAQPVQDPLEVIDSPDIDVVYVCVPTAGHKELVLRAAQRGKHIFCEKPLATNLADAEEMAGAVDRAGVPAGVGLVLRHSPVMTVIKDLMEDATLGSLMAIVFRDDQFFPIAGHYASDWRKHREIVGSGTLLEHSIHDVDVLRWLGGEVVSVRGSVRNFAGHEGVEDLAMAHIEFEGGGQASLVSIWHSVIGRPSTRRLEVFMEKGLIWTDHDFIGPVHYQVHAQNAVALNDDQVVDRYLQIAGYERSRVESALRYSLEDYSYLKAVQEGRRPHPDFTTALEAHRIVDALYRSASGSSRTIALTE